MKSILFLLISVLVLPAGLLQAQSKQTKGDETRKILVLIAQGFNRREFHVPVDMWKEAGHEIVVAAREPGLVPVRLNGKPHRGDVEADRSFASIKDISGYDALFIPGGYSPGFLEEMPEAVRIVRKFMERDAPVGAICHGPRLLMAADLLEDRVATMLYQVPSEKADDWKAGEAGSFLDEAVVVDENLVTSRYPNDAEVFAETFAAKFTGKEARANAEGAPEGEKAHFALWPGFDEAVFLSLRYQLEAMGYEPVPVGPRTGWIKGLHGYPVKVVSAYATMKQPAGLVIAPGGLWPTAGKKARQADIPVWVNEMEPDRKARERFIFDSYESGGNVVIFGYDTRMLEGYEPLKGTRLSAPDPLRWYFKKGGPRFREEAVSKPGDGLWTAKGASALPEVIREVIPAIAGNK